MKSRKAEKKDASAPGKSGDRFLPTLFLVFLLLYLLLIIGVRLYPFVDLPNHLAAATIYKYYGAQSNSFPAYYNLELFPRPNVFHVLFMGSGIFPSVEAGAKALLALYVILLPTMVFLLIRRSGGNPWFAFLSFPVIFNYNLDWGFVGFTFGIPIFLLLFYCLIEHQKRERLLTGVLVSGLFLLLFFIHGLLTLFALFVFIVGTVWSCRTSILCFLRRVILILPVAGIYLWWWLAWPGVGLPKFLIRYYANDYLPGLGTRLSELTFRDGYFLSAGAGGKMLGIFFFLCLTTPLIVWLLTRNRKKKHRKQHPLVGPFVVLAICALASCLFVPYQIPGVALLYQRFSSILLVSLVLLAGVLLPGRLSIAGKIAILAVSLISLTLWTDYLVTFDRSNSSFTKDFMPWDIQRREMGGVIYDYQYRGQPVYIHFPNYYTVWRQGAATTSLIDYRPGAVKRASARYRLPYYNAWVGKHNNYDGRYRNLDYILVRGNVPEKDLDLYQDFRVKNQIPGWTMFQHLAAESKPRP